MLGIHGGKGSGEVKPITALLGGAVRPLLALTAGNHLQGKR